MDAVLYFGKAYYREHVYHVVDVFVFGLLLLEARITEKPHRDRRSCLLNWVREKMWAKHGGKPEPDDDIKRDLVLQNWALASLFHDVGYALETVQAVAPLMQYIGSGPTGVYAQVIERALGQATKKFYKTVREQDIPAGSSAYSGFLGTLPNLSNLRRGSINHGITSFCHLLHLLMEVDRRDGVLKRAAESPAPTRMVDSFLPALRAVFHHHLTDQPVDMESDPLSFLLALVDELQDWGRRRVDRREMAEGCRSQTDSQKRGV